MKKTFLVIILCLLMLPEYGGGPCLAAGKNWDRILDKYESLCESCLKLKLKAEAGEKVPKASLRSLFSSLSELRAELGSGQGSMSEVQRSRFESIRTKYALLFGVGDVLDETGQRRLADGGTESREIKGNAAQSDKDEGAKPYEDVEVTPQKFAAVNPVTQRHDVVKDGPGPRTGSLDLTGSRPEGPDSSRAIVRQHIPELPRLHVPLSAAVAEGFAACPDFAVASERPGSFGESVPSAGRRFSASVSAMFSFLPEFSYGASIAISPGAGRWSIYIKYVGNHKTASYSYICYSDGSYGGGKLWTTGESTVSCLRASAGFRRELGRWGGIAAGAGYGRTVVLWEDIGHAWAKVKDLSISGIVLEAGPQFHAGPFDLQLVLSTVNFRSPALEFGLGYRF